ncbi:pentapeptide repeat-containing protein [Vibrio pectenicida]|uniref:pentapeptide repeat-containing protein n=1 Tax=Vibrio pectenicida TaxID=62763 RepID=UPI003453D21B
MGFQFAKLVTLLLDDHDRGHVHLDSYHGYHHLDCDQIDVHHLVEHLRGCHLRGCHLRGCHLRGCHLRGCHLRDVHLHGYHGNHHHDARHHLFHDLNHGGHEVHGSRRSHKPQHLLASGEFEAYVVFLPFQKASLLEAEHKFRLELA